MSQSIQEYKEKIDGFHCLVAEGLLSEADAGDEICNLLRDLDDAAHDELHDYADESFGRFGLGK